MTVITPTAEVEFQTQLFSVVEHLRGALTDLLGGIGADSAVPYAVSRQLGINKNLSWKVCRIITTRDPFGAVEHLPGAQGVEILLDAAAEHGASDGSIEAVRSALLEFDRLVETHAGDRRTLDLMVASHHEAPQAPIEESRRLAFEGNSTIWGVQGRARFASFFIAPSVEGDGMVDCAVVGGLSVVRVMRPLVFVPLFQQQAYNDDGTLRRPRRVPLDPDASPDDPSMLIRSFCSPNAPPLEAQRMSDAIRFELPRGPVGRSGLATWVYGWRTLRLGSLYRDEVNHYGEHPTRVVVPVEAMQSDLYLHRSLPLHDHIRGALYSQLAGQPYMGADQARDELPVRERVEPLGGRPPVSSTPLIPRYSEIVRYSFERLGWDANEFLGYRFVMNYPPIPTVFVMRYDLAERPA